MSKAFIWTIWLVYVVYLLFSDLPPGPSLLHINAELLQEVWDLSLNFWFITPLVLPDSAPLLHPALEGLFNMVVAWALLLWGFLVDGRGQKWPMLPFLVGIAFLTNVFYLPWLGIRRSNPEWGDFPLSPLEQVTESRGWSLFLTGIVFLSVSWALFARPEFGNMGQRWQDLMQIISSDRLAYSFAIDLLFFSLFQSWLVGDDMKRRQWHNPTILWVTRLIPFFGLVAYFLLRPPLPIPDTTVSLEPKKQ